VGLSRGRSRPSYILAVLVLAAVTLVTLDVRGGGSSALHHVRNRVQAGLSSVQGAVHDGLRPIGNFITGAANYGSLRAENTVLRQDLAAARATEEKSAYDQAQADQVLRSSHISFADQYRTVVAGVTNQSSSNFDEAITVAKGSSSGIVVGQPVVTASGLAGQVSAVSGASATVTLLSNPQLIVGVGLPGGNVGSAQSLGPGQGLAVSVIATSKPRPALAKGAVLYTSAIGRGFPAGIPVGTVASVTGGSGDAEPSVTVRPFVDTANLAYVTIVLWSSQ
jgi:rod shape-determining protein MreC